MVVFLITWQRWKMKHLKYEREAFVQRMVRCIELWVREKDGEHMKVFNNVISSLALTRLSSV